MPNYILRDYDDSIIGTFTDHMEAQQARVYIAESRSEGGGRDAFIVAYDEIFIERVDK